MRIVVKVGTNVLTNNSYQIQHSKIKEIAGELAQLQKKRHEVVLVSSGAIGSGREQLPNITTAESKRVWAAVGQPLLMHLYTKYSAKFKNPVGQCLLLRNDFTDRGRYDNVVKTIKGLLAAGALPIINENDVVSMTDLTVGDNDLLAAMVAIAIGADRLILLTNQKGLFTANPDTHKDARLVKEVANVDSALEKLYTKEVSTLGRGGMLSKVRAAKHAVHAGIETYIADGREKNILGRLFGSERPGTKFIALPKNLNDQKRWLMSAKGFGQLIVDAGAVKALHAGKSLLLPGIISAHGLFDKGEIVEIATKTGATVAYGKVNYDSKGIRAAVDLAKKSGKKNILDKEAVHRNYMVVVHV